MAERILWICESTNRMPPFLFSMRQPAHAISMPHPAIVQAFAGRCLS
jgi:hypothetical protein